MTFVPPECDFLRAALPRLELLYDLPLLLLSAAALPILEKCAVIPVYRQSPQCGEHSNAAFRTQSAAKQTSLAPHDSKARLRVVTTRRDSWRSHVHRTHTAQRVQPFKLQTRNGGVKGQGPLRSLGGPRGDILSRERISPLSAAPHGVGKSRSLFGLLPLRAMRGKREDFSFEKPSLFTYFLLCRSNYSASCIAFAAATAFACASAEHCS